jgi:hypothetical protein
MNSKKIYKFDNEFDTTRSSKYERYIYLCELLYEKPRKRPIHKQTLDKEIQRLRQKYLYRQMLGTVK